MFGSELRSERQERDVLRPLDGDRQPALMSRAGSRHPPRENLAAFLHERLKDLWLFVVDQINLVHAEAADFFLANVIALAAPMRPSGPSTWPSAFGSARSSPSS